MNPNRTLALHEPHDERHRVFWWNPQAQVDVIGHGMPFKHLDLFLLTELAKYPAYRPPQFPKYRLSPVLRDEYNVVLALPTDVRQRLELFHTLYLHWPSGANNTALRKGRLNLVTTSLMLTR